MSISPTTKNTLRYILKFIQTRSEISSIPTCGKMSYVITMKINLTIIASRHFDKKSIVTLDFSCLWVICCMLFAHWT